MELQSPQTVNFFTSRVLLPVSKVEKAEPLNTLSIKETSVAAPSAEKTLKPVEYVSRIFSPHLTPSAVHIENRQLAQNSIGPVYRHNIALTKYFNVSITPKLLAHLHTSLIAWCYCIKSAYFSASNTIIKVVGCLTAKRPACRTGIFSALFGSINKSFEILIDCDKGVELFFTL